MRRRCEGCGRFAGLGNTTQWRFYPGKYSETSARRCDYCGWAKVFFKSITIEGWGRITKKIYAKGFMDLLNSETTFYNRFRRVA